MRSRASIALILLLAPVLAAACGGDNDDEEKLGEPIALLDQVGVVGSHLVLIDVESDRAFLLDLSAKDLDASLSEVPLAPNPFWIEAREGKTQEALILSAGRRGVSESTLLTALRVNGKVREYPLQAPFDTIVQTERGRYAVLYFGDRAEELLFSPDEIAVIDLEAEPDEKNAVVRRNFETPGGPPTVIEISPRLSIGDLKREFAVLLSESHVTIVDLVNSERRETVVRLSDAEGEEAVRPEQVVFDESRRQIHVRAANSNDIYVLQLEPNSKDFSTGVTQVPVGAEPTDMGLYGEEDSKRLLVVSNGGAHIVDLSPGDASSDRPSREEPEEPDVSLPPRVSHIALEVGAERLLTFETEVSGEDGPEKRYHALLYQRGNPKVSFLDLYEAETFGEQNLSTLRLREPVTAVEPLLDHGLALCFHESSRLTVLDLKKKKAISIAVNSPIRKAVYSTDRPRLWIAPPGQHFVGYVDLLTGNTGEVLLNDPLSQFAVVPDQDLVVAVHEFGESKEDDYRKNTIGVTLLDAVEPSRETAVFFSDFLEYE